MIFTFLPSFGHGEFAFSSDPCEGIGVFLIDDFGDAFLFFPRQLSAEAFGAFLDVEQSFYGVIDIAVFESLEGILGVMHDEEDFVLEVIGGQGGEDCAAIWVRDVFPGGRLIGLVHFPDFILDAILAFAGAIFVRNFFASAIIALAWAFFWHRRFLVFLL